MNSSKNISILSNINKAYIYPMANATNGGESHSEYNIRNSLASLVSHSAAFSESDFNIVYSNFSTNSTTDNNDTIHQLSLAISSGKGNCNGYFVECGEFGSYIKSEDSQSIDNSIKLDIDFNNLLEYLPTNCTDYKFTVGLYLCIDYANNIADGLSYKLLQDSWTTEIDESDVEDTQMGKLLDSVYKPLGFSDVGILLGTMTVYHSKDGFTVDGSEGIFINNKNKTRSIDLSRLGSNRGLAEELSNMINRLQKLNIFGGSFYVSDTLYAKDGKNIKDIGSDGAESEYGGDYRFKMHLNIDPKTNDSTNFISGGLSLVKTELSDTQDVEIANILSFKCTKPVENSGTYASDIEIAIRENLTVNNLCSDSITVNSITVKGDKILIGNDASIYYNSSEIKFNKSIRTENTVFANEVRANAVYGAVWQ